MSVMEKETAVGRKILEQNGILKVLTLGHSLAVDACHMLALVARAEGIRHLLIGTLYYSGCSMERHVRYLTEDIAEYNLYISSTFSPDDPPKILKKVTMGESLAFNDWDIIIMQAGVFEVAREEAFQAGYLETIKNYVNAHKRNPNAVFGWNMTWATPTDNELRDKYPYPERNSYYTSYERFGQCRDTFYSGIIRCIRENILTDGDIRLLIPTGTAMENALSSYLTERALHRDYAHATDFARVMAAYTWLCSLLGIRQLEEIKLDTIPVNFFKSTKDTEDRVLTPMEKAIILESVNNALAAPLERTQSRYTQE